MSGSDLDAGIKLGLRYAQQFLTGAGAAADAFGQGSLGRAFTAAAEELGRVDVDLVRAEAQS